MKIVEVTYTVNRFGSLKIPQQTLYEMGLKPGHHVRVAYLTSDGKENTYREFLLSPDPLDESGDEKCLAIPTELFVQANIPLNADIQVFCIDGAIVISQDTALNTEDLSMILSSLEVAGDILWQLPGDTNAAADALRQFIDDNEEGAYADDDDY